MFEDSRAALTRKLGPLPVWAWALIGGIGLYWFRSRQSGGGGLASLFGLQSGVGAAYSGPGQVDPNTGIPYAYEAGAASGPTQDQVTLQPGETVYDPNTGALLGTAPSQMPPQDPITLQPGESIYNPNTGSIQGAFTQGPAGPAGASAPAPKATRKQPALRGKGAIRAPFGHNKPATPKGYRDVGLGSGFWEFLPVKSRKPAKKAGSHPAKPVRRPTSGQTRARSTAAVHKTSTGNRPTQAQRRPAAPAPRNPAPPAPSRYRPARPVPAAQAPAVRNRPQATHPAVKPKAAPPPPPRASSPPSRHVPAPTGRRPAKPAARPRPAPARPPARRR